MVYRKAKQKVKRVYSRSKSIFNGDIFKNPYIVGLVAGAAKNALAGKKIIVKMAIAVEDYWPRSFSPDQ